jgi:alpha-beta hydrolase superfamily lysophospholipase
MLLQAASAGLAISGAHYYFTHPRRVMVLAPPDLLAHIADVYLLAPDGARLHAFWVRSAGESSSRTILQYHGYNSAGGLLMGLNPTPLMAWPLVRQARQRGYNLLLVDARAHGRSEGPWSVAGGQLVTDIAMWARWLRTEHGQLWVGLWGNSLGATMGLIQAARPASGGLDALVLDSMPISADGLYSGLLGSTAALVVQPVLRHLTDTLRARAFPEGRLPVKTHGWPPILLVHGADDRHVPVEHSVKALAMLQQAGGDQSALWLVPGADHLMSLDVADAEYVERVLAWFDLWFGGNGDGGSNA